MIHVLQSNHPKAKSLRLRPMALKWGLKRCTMFNDLLCTVHFVLKIFGLWNSFLSAISFVLSIGNPKQPKSFSRIFTNRYFFYDIQQRLRSLVATGDQGRNIVLYHLTICGKKTPQQDKRICLFHSIKTESDEHLEL